MFSGCSHLAFIGPGGPEIIVVMLVLLLMFGAKDAPRIFRKINEMINSIRNTADGFRREIMYSDVNSTPTPDYSSDDSYDHDDDYGYADESEDPSEEGHEEGIFSDEERDYSDEIFHNLDAEVADPVPEVAESGEQEDDDAEKA